MRTFTGFDFGVFQRRHAMIIYILSRLSFFEEIDVAIGAVHRDMAGQIAQHSHGSLQAFDENIFSDLTS